MIGQLDNTMMRELSADELLAVSGAKPMEAEAGRYQLEYNERFNFLGLTWFFQGGEGWLSVCVANDSTYRCVTGVEGKVYTSSGPVPK